MVTPGRKQYENKYKEYIQEREERPPPPEEKRWRKYDSPIKEMGKRRGDFPDHLMGFVEEPKARIRSNSIGGIEKTIKPENLETFLPLRPSEKKIFYFLKDFYNKLEGSEIDSVDIDGLLDALEVNKELRNMFFIDEITDIENELKDRKSVV